MKPSLHIYFFKLLAIEDLMKLSLFFHHYDYLVFLNYVSIEVALDETQHFNCLHFSMQNIEQLHDCM